VTYWDTSALVKLFVSEPGSSKARSLLRRDREVATAHLTYVEMYSAFTRRHRDRSLSVAHLRAARRLFEREWGAYLRLPLTEDIVQRSRVMVELHGLKSLDAIHLGTLLDLGDKLDEPVGLVAADGRLVRAATAERCHAVTVG
jgi:hypothetical protein